MRIRIAIASLAFLLMQSSALAEQLLYVKYRPTPVDVDNAHFEYLDTSRSSVIGGAWYDKTNNYMVINVGGTNYHYCGLNEAVWRRYAASSSFGSAYNAFIKGNFDCRIFPVPTYGD